ncbi:MAG: RNA polymerase sigma factor, partial [Phycisphaerales bacterium]
RECWKTLRRRDRLRPSMLPEDLASSTDEGTLGIESLERRQIVRESLVELGGRCQRLLEALFSVPGEPSYPEIAARLDMPIGSIGPTRARCLGRLAEILGRRGIRNEAGGSSSSEPAHGDPGDFPRRTTR